MERRGNEPKITIKGQTLGQRFDHFMTQALGYSPRQQNLIVAREQAPVVIPRDKSYQMRRSMFRGPRDGRGRQIRR